MSKLQGIIQNRIFQNLLIWFLIYLFLFTTQPDHKFVVPLVVIALLAPPVYINNLYIIPLFKSNKLLFVLLFLLNALIFTSLGIIVLIFYLNQEFSINMFSLLGMTFLALLFGGAFKLVRDSFDRKRFNQEVELKLLKGQLNPHFLFNTLNNLYGLSVIKSDKLPDLMLKLSDLLRYSLYETKEEFVLLSKEIQYLENYIALEEIRLEEKVKVSFTKEGINNITGKKIAPMLFIVFLENAFKHFKEHTNGVGEIDVKLVLQENDITFECSNSILLTDKLSLDQKQEMKSSGLGLNNVRQRLSLIYPGMHKYNAGLNGNKYHVKLNISF